MKKQITKENPKISWKEENIKPILSYFFFTTKYILKKKSTLFGPILSFISILVLSLLPMFIVDPDSADLEKQSYLFIFLPIVLTSSIIIVGSFAVVKALNLFKDTSSEGLEILIVSKPIRRGQIILVRFIYFLILGIFLCFINYIAVVIGISIALNVYPENFSLINHASIYFVSILFAYILFGSISILFSLKFSTKFTSGFSFGVIAIGGSLVSTLPMIAVQFSESIQNKIFQLEQNQSQPGANPSPQTSLNLGFYVTTKGEIIIFDDSYEAKTPVLTPAQIDLITRAFNEKRDLSWLKVANDFINPVAGLTKITSPKPLLITPGYRNEPNFLDYNFSLQENVAIENNFYNGFNYFVKAKNWYNIGSNAYLKFDLILADGSPKTVFLNNFEGLNYSEFYNNNVKASISKVFDSLLNQSLLNLQPEFLINKIYEESKIVFRNLLDEILKSIDTENMRLSIATPEGVPDTNNFLKQADFNVADFEKSIILLFFYDYGLKKMNNNFQNFQNKDLFTISATQGSKVNTFLGKNFSFYRSIFNNSLGKTEIVPIDPLLTKQLQDQKMGLILKNNGEKASSVAVGLMWSSIILLVLTGTIFSYYRKDFV